MIPVRQRLRHWKPAVAALFLAAMWEGPAAGQEPPSAPGNTVASPVNAPAEPLPESKMGAWQWQGFKFFPQASGGVRADDNINIQPKNREGDVIWNLSPGCSVMAGDPGVEVPPTATFQDLRLLPRQPYASLQAAPAKMLLLNYAPNLRLYTSHDQYSGADESAFFTGVYAFSRLTLGLDQDYLKQLSAINDVGSLVNAQNLNTHFTAKYDLTDRTSLEANGDYLNTSYAAPSLIGSREWANQDWLNRQLFSKVTASLGFRFEYWDVDRNPSQTAEQVLARAIYWLAEKLQFTASVGPEWRQFSGGAPATVDPVFSLAAAYRPLDSTTLTVEGHRRPLASAAYGDQNYTESGFSFTLQQRVLSRWFPGVSVGYYQVQYSATTSGVAARRSDAYFNVGANLDCRLSDRWKIGLFYRYRSDSSNLAYAYYDNQVGLQATWGRW